MKKYTLFLVAIIFIFSLFYFGLNSSAQKALAQANVCYYTQPSGLPACTGGCYVPKGGPSGGDPADYWQCLVGGGYASQTYSCTGTVPAGSVTCSGTGAGLTTSRPFTSVATCSANQADKCEYHTQASGSGSGGGASCSLASAPIPFEPGPPGAARPTNMSSSQSYNLQIYQSGGSKRILMREAFGYSVLDISNPLNPTALLYNDMRFADDIPCSGDGQSYNAAQGVSSDGERAVFSLNGCGTPGHNTVVGSASGNGFKITGDYVPSGQNNVVIQKSGSRYIAYTLRPEAMTAQDITTLPASLPSAYSTEVSNMPTAEIVSGVAGYGLKLAGNYLVFWSEGVVQILDASNPGPAGSITAAYPRYQVTSADLGGRKPGNTSAAVDPSDPAKLWVLIELSDTQGTGYALVSLKNGVKTVVGKPFQIPKLAGETWTQSGTSALIPSGNNLFVFMWATRTAAPFTYRLFSTSVASWGTAPGWFDVDPAVSTRFSLFSTMEGFAGSGNAMYAYLPTGNSAFVLPMTCTTTTSTGGGGGGNPPVVTVTPPASCTHGPYNTITGQLCGTSQGAGCEKYLFSPTTGASCATFQPQTHNPSDGGRKCLYYGLYYCLEWAPETQTPSNAPATGGTFIQPLKRGSTGSEVTDLQNTLNSKGYNAGTADGVFGPKTQQALIQFQIANGLVGDGVVGPLTREALNR